MTHKITLSIAALILSLAPAYAAITPGQAPSNETVRRELVKMGEDDQKLRQEMQDLLNNLAGLKREKVDKRLKQAVERQNEVDNKNRQRLDEIVKEHGWPKTSVFGQEASGAAFLIVQHAELEYQKKYFPLIKEAAAKNEARPTDLALLEDRILTRDGKRQLYGTQLRFNDRTKSMELYPIEDEQNVDTRRSSVGLPPLALYLKEFGIDYVLSKKN